jgi:hypothetical protein
MLINFTRVQDRLLEAINKITAPVVSTRADLDLDLDLDMPINFARVVEHALGCTTSEDNPDSAVISVSSSSSDRYITRCFLVYGRSYQVGVLARCAMQSINLCVLAWACRCQKVCQLNRV